MVPGTRAAARWSLQTSTPHGTLWVQPRSDVMIVCQSTIPAAGLAMIAAAGTMTETWTGVGAVTETGTGFATVQGVAPGIPEGRRAPCLVHSFSDDLFGVLGEGP